MRTTAPEAPILRRTRWRLIAWSGGSTLVVLIVLGIAIYVAAATSLAASGTRQLQARLDELGGAGFGPVSVAATQVVGLTSDPSQPGLVIGGDAVLLPGMADFLDSLTRRMGDVFSSDRSNLSVFALGVTPGALFSRRVDFVRRALAGRLSGA